MAELTTTERLQPALLDRLTDDEPKERLESRDRRVMSMRQLRAAVLRDLSWLLNSPSRPAGDEIYDYPLVARSVLNYGMADLSGLTATSARSRRLEHQVRDAVLRFEPRIVASTLQVRIAQDGTTDSTRHAYAFEIAGDVCPLPMPEALYVRTEVDLETGRCEIRERP